MQLAITLLFSLVLCIVDARAEGVLIKGYPENNAELTQFDGRINLWFSGNISDRYPSLVVIDAEGKRVDNKDVQLQIDDRTQLSVSTKPLSAGHYAFRYRVVTEDGLVVSGIRHFSIKE